MAYRFDGDESKINRFNVAIIAPKSPGNDIACPRSADCKLAINNAAGIPFPLTSPIENANTPFSSCRKSYESPATPRAGRQYPQ